MKKQLKNLVNPFMIAPMMGWTTRHYRYFMRLITPIVTLYTEMITTAALLNNPLAQRFLTYHASEKPLVIQLGGSNPEELAAAAKIVYAHGYSEINLNVGCPSNRVQSGCFGAVLMKNSRLLSECIAAMTSAVPASISVKMRLGVDEYDSYDYLVKLIEKVSEAGCNTFIIHARKAWLQGLSPKKNREIPPLNYDWVYQLKRLFPHFTIILNGGITNLVSAREHLHYVDGVMIGRAAWYTPYMMRALTLNHCNESREADLADRLSIMKVYMDYAQAAFLRGENLSYLLQPLFGLFHGIVGAKLWRCQLMQAIQTNKPPASLTEEIIYKPYFR